MKIYAVILFALAGLMNSCASTDEAVGSAAENSFPERPDTSGYIGIITNAYASQGCDYLFEYKDENDVTVIVRPFELEDKYKVHGMHVRMRFRMSRMMNGTCDLAHPVIVEFIEELQTR